MRLVIQNCITTNKHDKLSTNLREIFDLYLHSLKYRLVYVDRVQYSTPYSINRKDTHNEPHPSDSHALSIRQYVLTLSLTIPQRVW